MEQRKTQIINKQRSKETKLMNKITKNQTTQLSLQTPPVILRCAKLVEGNLLALLRSRSRVQNLSCLKHPPPTTDVTL